LYICLCNRQSKNSCDIRFIYVKLPNYMYSQCIGIWAIFGFLASYL
jgi:hypothetical protein